MIPELKIHLGPCQDTMAQWPDACVDAVVTDPPYELGFMGKTWDSTGIAYSVPMWSEVLRVLKPGGHLLAFGGTRTYHRMACAIEDAGFDIRDQLQWLYGSGFPKSLDVSKAIDKGAGAEREVVGQSETLLQQRDAPNSYSGGWKDKSDVGKRVLITAPATDSAKTWAGWGTALKPANEPICLARKPLSEGTVAANVLRWGTGALNIEAARIGEGVESWPKSRSWAKAGGPKPSGATAEERGDVQETGDAPSGRWPANILFDQYAAGMLDAQMSDASRFFYVAKPDGGERNCGLEDEEQFVSPKNGAAKRITVGGSKDVALPRANFHPTVKPVDLMSYLVQLITPPGGIVLDPFTGSGTTGIAAARLGFSFIGCEMNPEYIAIAEKRIAPELAQGKFL